MSCPVWCRLLVAVGVLLAHSHPGTGGAGLRKTSDTSIEKTSAMEKTKRTVDGAVVHDMVNADSSPDEGTEKPFLEEPSSGEESASKERGLKDSMPEEAQAALETGGTATPAAPGTPPPPGGTPTTPTTYTTCPPNPPRPCEDNGNASDATCLTAYAATGQVFAYSCPGAGSGTACCCTETQATFGSTPTPDTACTRKLDGPGSAAAVSAGPIWTVLLLSLLVSSWTSF